MEQSHIHVQREHCFFFYECQEICEPDFHKGATIKDNGGLLEGDGKESRVARFVDLNDIEKKKEVLQEVIREWIRMQDA